MEVPFIPKNVLHKAGSPAKNGGVRAREALKAYQNEAGSTTDSVNISSKSRLMQKLSAEYENLDNTSGSRVESLKNTGVPTVSSMSAEEIVEGILRGTLFDVI